MYVGIEIGGTKLQLGLGPGDGTLAAIWRGEVQPHLGADGIRRQIVDAFPKLVNQSNTDRSAIRGIGVGFGGPINDRTRCVIKSHQIEGWDGSPLAKWLEESLGIPTELGNDADVAALAEAVFGAGRGFDPTFYITLGSGIGGGLILNGKIHRGTGWGAAEIGHLRTSTPNGHFTVEELVSGWGIERRSGVSVPEWARRWRAGDSHAIEFLTECWSYLAEAICQVIALVAPARIIIGGGVALVGEDVLFEPLRKLVAERVFKPFAGTYQIAPAQLGESVVVHGAIALAAKR